MAMAHTHPNDIITNTFNLAADVNAYTAQIPGLLCHAYGSQVQGPKALQPKVLEDVCSVYSLANVTQFADLPLLQQESLLKRFVMNLTAQIQEYRQEMKSGSTLLFTMLMGNKCLISNTGDSAAFSVTINDENISVERLTKAHRIADPSEQDFINLIFGTVIYPTQKETENKIVRLKIGNGQYDHIALSRTLLSHYYFGVSSLPDITEFSANAEKSFLLLCTDGLTDVLAIEDIKQIISEILQQYGNLTSCNVAEILVATARERGSKDDISAIFSPVQPNINTILMAADGHGMGHVPQLILEHFPAILAQTINMHPVVAAGAPFQVSRCSEATETPDTQPEQSSIPTPPWPTPAELTTAAKQTESSDKLVTAKRPHSPTMFTQPVPEPDAPAEPAAKKLKPGGTHAEVTETLQKNSPHAS